MALQSLAPSSRRLGRSLLVAACAAFAPHVAAQTTFIKASNTTALNLAGSWTINSGVPGESDTLHWNNTLAGANSTAIGGNLSVRGLLVSNPGGAITVTHAAGNILTLGSGGIDMSAASQNLSLFYNADNSSGTNSLTNPINFASTLVVGANQTWNVNALRTLTLFRGSNVVNQRLSGSGNITKTGAGTVLMSVGDFSSTGVGQDGNGNDSFSGNWTITAGKVQAQRNDTHAWGRGTITLNGGTIAQVNGNWTWSNNIDVTAASVIGSDSSNGLGRTLKLTGDLTSATSQGLTFTNTTTGGTKTDNVGFLLAGANASTYGTTTISANSRVRVGGNAFNHVDTRNTTDVGFAAGNRGSLGTGAVSLAAVSSELAFTRTDAHVVGNAISGLGSVVIGGITAETSGTTTQVVTLSGTSTYSGPTRVSRSRLHLTGSLTSAITVNTSGSISGTGSTTGLLTLASGSNLVLAGGAATASLTTNGATFSGSNTVTFLGDAVAGTAYDVLTYGNGTLTTLANLTVGWRGSLVNDTVNKKLVFTAGANGLRTWNTGTGTWAQNGDANFAEGDQKFFGGDQVVFGDIAADAIVTLSGPVLPGSVTVTNSANAYTFAGGALGGAAALAKSGAGTLLLSVANSHGGGTTVSAGTLRLGAAGALGSGSVTVNGGTLDVAALAPSNVISLAGAGNGTTPALWNSSVAAGATLGGAITLAADAAVGNATADAGKLLTLGSLNLNGKRLTVASGAVAVAIRNLNNGDITVASGGVLYSQSGGSLASASGTITVNAGGKFETRDTDNTAMASTHDIVLNGGALSTATIVGNNGGGSGTILRNNILVDATNGGTLTGNNTAFLVNLRLRGSLSGSGSLTIDGAQGVELQGDAAGYSGTATVTAGTLTFAPSASQTFAGVIAGIRPLVKSGAGTTTFLGANTYDATLTITAGTLQVGNGGTTGSLGSGAVTNDAALAFNRSDDVVVGNAISGTGSLTQSGGGKLILTGANAYGATAITAGTLQVGNGGTAGSLGSGAVTNDAALAFDRSDDVVVGNAISGTGSLTKLGAAKLTLTGANAYGATAITAGTLQVGNGGTTGSLGSGAVTNDAALAFNRSDDVVVGNAISGSGSLTKLGAGKLTLTGASTYAGATTVSSGTLVIASGGSLHAGSAVGVDNGAVLSVLAGGAVSGPTQLANGASLSGAGTVGAVTLASGASIAAGTSGSGVLTLGSLTLGQSAADTSTISFGIAGVSGSGTLASSLQVNGDITVNSGTGKVTLAFGSALANLVGGTAESPVLYDLITYSGGQLADVDAFAYTGTTGARQGVQVVNGVKVVQLSVSAAYPIWKGTTDDWSSPVAWKLNSDASDTGFLANDTVLFDDTAASGAVSLSADVAPLSVTFVNSDRDYDLGGAGRITDGSLLKSGTGALTLRAAHTYGGGTTLSAGRIRLGVDNALGSALVAATGGTLSSDGLAPRALSNPFSLSGTVTLGHAVDSGALALSGAVALAGAVTLDVVSEATLSGGVSGGVLTKTGNQALTLTAAGTNSGFVLGSGRVRVGDNDALGSGGVTLHGGQLSSVGSGARTLANALTISGDVTLGDASDNGALTLAGSVGLGGGARTLTLASNATLTGAVTNGSLVKAGPGTLTVSGADRLGVATTISQGTLALGAAGSVADAVALTVSTNGTLDLGGNSETVGAVGLEGGVIANGTLVAALTVTSGTLSAILGGTGSLTKNGAGSFSLTTASGYSGATVINAGTLVVGDGASAGVLGSGAVTNDAALRFNRSNAVTVSNQISGTGSVRFSGGGSYLVGVANAYEGGAILDAGTTLQVTNASALGTGALTVNGGTLTSGATALQLGNNLTLAAGLTLTGNATTQGLRFNGVISGSGGLTLNLTYTSATNFGRVTLIGDNTFAGPTVLGSGLLAINLKSLEQSSSVTLNPSAGTLAFLAVGGNGGTTLINNLSGTSGGQIITSFNIVADGARSLKINQTVDGVFGVAGVVAIDEGGANRRLTITKSGAAKLTLAGTSDHTGGIVLSQGTLVGLSNTSFGANDAGTTLDMITVNDAETGVNDTTLLIGGAGTNMSRPIAVANLGTGVVTLGSAGGAGAQTFSGAITLARSVVLDAADIGDRLTFTGGIGGTGDVTIDGTPDPLTPGSGRVVFEATANAYSGSTTILAGSILQLGTGTSALDLLPDAGVVTVGAGGFLKLAKGSNNETIGGLVGAGTVRAHEGVASASAVLTVANAADQEFAGVLEDGGATGSSLSLIKSGSGKQTLSGANAYTGTTVINAGVLQVGNGGVTGSLGSGAVTINGALRLDRSDSWIMANDISGAGSLTQAGAGTVTLSGSLVAFTGAMGVESGTLALDGVVAGSSLALDDGSGVALRVLASSSVAGISGGMGRTANLEAGALTVDLASGEQTFAGSFAGAGHLVKSGGGTLVLAGANGHADTTVLAGTLRLSGSATLGTGAIIVNGGTLDLNGVATPGAITLAAGKLMGAGLADGGVTITGDAALAGVVAGSVALGSTYSRAVDVTEGLAVQGTLSGVGSFTGNLTVAGTHAVGNSPGYQLVTGELTYDAGAYFDWEVAGPGDWSAGYAPDRSSLLGPGDYDAVDVSGTLTIAPGAILRITSIDSYGHAFWSTPGSQVSFKVFDVTAFINGDFLFENGTDTLAVGALGSWVLRREIAERAESQGIYLTFSVIPEPSSYGLILGGLSLAVGAWRRRKAKQG